MAEGDPTFALTNEKVESPLPRKTGRGGVEVEAGVGWGGLGGTSGAWSWM